MPKVPPEIKAAFALGAVIKIRALQIDLEKFSCNKIRSLAVRAKEANKIETSRLYYKAWAGKMLNLRRLQKDKKQQEKLMAKETKSLLVKKKVKASLPTVIANPNVTLLRQLC